MTLTCICSVVIPTLFGSVSSVLNISLFRSVFISSLSDEQSQTISNFDHGNLIQYFSLISMMKSKNNAARILVFFLKRVILKEICSIYSRISMEKNLKNL